MYFPFWIILLGAIIWYIFFYKKHLSPEQTKELISERLASISNATKANLENSHIKEYLDTEKHFFVTMESNYLRLTERFKHDNVKLAQIVKDWIDYNEVISELIYQRELLDAAPSNKEADDAAEEIRKIHIKRQEIETRYQSLLGKEYSNPLDILNKKKSA